MKTILITGASGGIGRECAILLSSVHNIIIVGRNKDGLMETKRSCSTNCCVEIIVADISKSSDVKNLFSSLNKKNITVDWLINNAGMGDYGLFKDVDIEKQKSMIDCNVSGLVEVTWNYLNQSSFPKNGRILNLCSVASFFPGPYMSVYFASKAFVLSFSEALMEELKSDSISVTAFCPGPTKTNFSSTAGVVFPENIPEAKEVAHLAISAMTNNKRIVVVGRANKRLVFLARIFSRRRIRQMMEKRRRPK